MRTAPHHLPKKVTKKPSVNHIGSSDEPPIIDPVFLEIQNVVQGFCSLEEIDFSLREYNCP